MIKFALCASACLLLANVVHAVEFVGTPDINCMDEWASSVNGTGVPEACMVNAVALTDVQPAECRARISGAISDFQTCFADAGQSLCSCYEKFFTAVFEPPSGSETICVTEFTVQQYLALQGFRFGVGYPAITSYDGNTCSGDFSGDYYTGYGQLLGSDPNCVPACSTVCDASQCSMASTNFGGFASLFLTMVMSLYLTL